MESDLKTAKSNEQISKKEMVRMSARLSQVKKEVSLMKTNVELKEKVVQQK